MMWHPNDISLNSYLQNGLSLTEKVYALLKKELVTKSEKGHF